MSLLFAATYPERTAAARPLEWHPRRCGRRIPVGPDRGASTARIPRATAALWLRDRHGGRAAAVVGPTTTRGAVPPLSQKRQSWRRRARARMNRRSTSGTCCRPSVSRHCLHDPMTPIVPIDGARYAAQRIPGARLVESQDRHIPPRDVAYRDDRPRQRFLNDVWRPAWAEADRDRVLATVLFTDIVGSSSEWRELGDRAWRELLERHHVARPARARGFRGVEVDTAGDGFFTDFDGPARAILCACAIVGRCRSSGLRSGRASHW